MNRQRTTQANTQVQKGRAKANNGAVDQPSDRARDSEATESTSMIPEYRRGFDLSRIPAQSKLREVLSSTPLDTAPVQSQAAPEPNATRTVTEEATPPASAAESPLVAPLGPEPDGGELPNASIEPAPEASPSAPQNVVPQPAAPSASPLPTATTPPAEEGGNQESVPSAVAPDTQTPSASAPTPTGEAEPISGPSPTSSPEQGPAPTGQAPTSSVPASSADSGPIGKPTPADAPGQEPAPTPQAPGAEITPAAPSPQSGVEPSSQAGVQSASTAPAAGPTLLVDNTTSDIAPGQMQVEAFLSELQVGVRKVAEAALQGTGRTTKDCPYIEYWFDYYSDKDSRHVEQAVHRYAPEARTATSAQEYIPLILARVRRGVEIWAATGEVTGVPTDLPADATDAPSTKRREMKVSTARNVLFKARDGATPRADDPEQIQADLGEGRPIDSNVRSRMESAFGTDFSGVRLHTDATGANLSDKYQARAFTVGQHVAFGANEYQPGTPMGDALLAHELAHVVQQSGSHDSSSAQTGDAGNRALEEDADRAAMGITGSIWNRITGSLRDIAQNAMPRLRSGLRMQRCPDSLSHSVTVGNLTFSSSGFSAEVGGPNVITDDPTIPAPGAVNVQTPNYHAEGKISVSGGTDAEAADWEAGFMQTVLSVDRKSTYVNAAAKTTKKIESSIPGPARDGDAGIIPWYGPETVRPYTKTGTAVSPAMDDAPSSRRPWVLAGHDLQSSSGKDTFASWLMIRQKSSSKIEYLNWATWQDNWDATFDPVKKTGSHTGPQSKVTGRGKGQGSATPVTGDPVANDAVVTKIT